MTHITRREAEEKLRLFEKALFDEGYCLGWDEDTMEVIVV